METRINNAVPVAPLERPRKSSNRFLNRIGGLMDPEQAQILF